MRYKLYYLSPVLGEHPVKIENDSIHESRIHQIELYCSNVNLERLGPSTHLKVLKKRNTLNRQKVCLTN